MPAQRSSHLRVQTAWVAVLDVVWFLFAMATAVYICIGATGFSHYIIHQYGGWIFFIASIILGNYLTGSYSMQQVYSRFDLIVKWLFTLAFAILFMSITSLAMLQFLLGRGVLMATVVSYSVLSLSFKLLVYRTLFRSGAFTCKTIVVGTGERAREMRKLVEREFVLPAHKVVSYIALKELGLPENGSADSAIDGVAVMTTSLKSFEDVVNSLGADLIIMGLDHPDHSVKIYPHLRHLRFRGTEVLSSQGAIEIYSGKVALDLVDEQWLTHASMESALPIVARAKRLMDIVTTMLMSIVAIPVGLFIALLIKLSAPGSPVIYVQEREGQFGQVFGMYKFRTMIVGAEESTGAIWAQEHDQRITRIGRFLRRFRMDEWPQFLNILRGEMSFVGPRPERPELVVELERKVPFYRERADVMPGLTGWAQIRYPYGDSVEDSRHKLEYDLYYIKHLSLSLDLQIILSTVQIVILGMERKMAGRKRPEGD